MFREAVFGNFTYQLVLQDLTDTNASLAYSYLDNPLFAAIMGGLYGDPNAMVKKGSSPLVYDPIPLHFSSGYNAFTAVVRIVLTYSLTIAGFAWLSYWWGGDPVDRKRKSHSYLHDNDWYVIAWYCYSLLRGNMHYIKLEHCVQISFNRLNLSTPEHIDFNWM